MRLTVIVPSLGRGGAERAASVLASGWAEQGNSVVLLTIDADNPPAYALHPAIQIRPLGLNTISRNSLQGLLANIRRIRIVRQRIREWKPDFVISFMHTTSIVTLLASRGLGVPVIICEQIDPGSLAIGQIWSFLRSCVYPFADVLVCPVAASLHGFQSIKSISRVAGRVIPNPIDVPAQSNEKPQREGRHVLAAMGRLVHEKGFDLLLQAFAQICERYPDWTLVIYGDGPLREALKHQAASLKLSKQVDFAGAVSDPFVRLRLADLFVFSSRTEGFGMALAEAMACGLAVVSFNCPSGPPEIIRNGLDGVLVPPGDINALASALDDLMGNPHARQRLAKRAVEAAERFQVKRVLCLWQELFDQLVSDTA